RIARPHAGRGKRPGAAHRDLRSHGRPAIFRGQRQRATRRGGEDRSRAAEPIHAGLLAAEPDARWKVSQGAGEAGSTERDANTAAVLEAGLLCTRAIGWAGLRPALSLSQPSRSSSRNSSPRFSLSARTWSYA